MFSAKDRGFLIFLLVIFAMEFSCCVWFPRSHTDPDPDGLEQRARLKARIDDAVKHNDPYLYVPPEDLPKK